MSAGSLTNELGDRDGHQSEEKIGYKHPPRKHQFKPGQSGNPRGRKKAAIGLRKILEQELTATIRIDVGKPGAPKTMSLSKLQVVVKRLVEKAMKGDQRAIEQLITLNVTIFGLGDADASAENQLSPGEQAYLDAVTRRFSSGDGDVGHMADPSAVGESEVNEDAAGV